jgi:hypothetical protein
MRVVTILVMVSAAAFAAGTGALPEPFGPIWADHDTGNVKMTITAYGGVGYLAPDSAGSGFRFPKAMTTSRLYYCGMLCGNDSSYIADRFYGNPAPNLNKDFAIVESLHRDNRYGGQEYSAVMADSRHPHAKNLQVSLHTIALPDPYGNGVIIMYDYLNNGPDPLNGMYAGLWADFDISSGGTADSGFTDPGRRLAFQRQKTNDNPNCGLVVLYPQQASNLSCVNHGTYVYPTDTCVTEYQKYRWLTGALHLGESDTAYDWSVIVATGPFDLMPGAHELKAFAMIAGISRAELLAKTDSLQAWYDLNVPAGLEGNSTNITFPSVLSITPNPVSGTSRISFGAPVRSEARLSLYDRAGKLVGTLWKGKLDGTTVSLNWNGCDGWGRRLESGVYFLRLKGNGLDHTIKTLLAR